MERRWGPGPVFVYESITAARRWQPYALRSFSVLALLAGLSTVWVSIGEDLRRSIAEGSIHDFASVGSSFFASIATVQISLVLLAAPAATAGAVCLDRARGSLAHVLVTDLSDAEIVLGKLFARLAPVLALVGGAVPVLAITTLLGGVDPAGVVVLTVVSLLVSVFGCSLALAVSVRATKTHEVLMAVYTVWIGLILIPLTWFVVEQVSSWPMISPPDWLFLFDPYYVVLNWTDVDDSPALALVAAGTVAVSVGLVVYSVRRLRGEVTGRTRGKTRKNRRGRSLWWQGPSLDGNPVLWREWQRSRPSRLTRVVWGLFAVSSVLGTGWSAGMTLWQGVDVVFELTLAVNALQVGLGLLLVSVAAPTALAEERVRGSLDVLLTTPLSTASIVTGKWWALYRVVPRLTILPAVGALVIALAVPEFGRGMASNPGADGVSSLDRVAAVVFPVAWVLAEGAVSTSVGLLLATWFPRVGRAVALSVALYVGITLAGLFLIESGLFEWVATCFGYEKPADESIVDLFTYTLSSFNPIFSQAMPEIALTMGRWSAGTRNWFWVGQAAGVVLTVGLAAGLFGLTVLTFEGCLGRCPERPRRAPRPPSRLANTRRGRVEPTPEPDLADLKA